MQNLEKSRFGAPRFQTYSEVLYAHEIYAYEIHAHKMHAYKIYTCKMYAREILLLGHGESNKVGACLDARQLPGPLTEVQYDSSRNCCRSCCPDTSRSSDVAAF